MSNDEYATLPGHNFEVRDVTKTFGKKLANLIRGVPRLDDLCFPRLHLPALKNRGYSPGDYRTIANLIGPDKIDVYETREFDMPFKGKYFSYGSLTAFIVTPELTVSPSLCISTLIHETTHAIQDWKKWRLSDQDMEIDAHFAEAFYLALNNKEQEVASESQMTRFVIAAKEYKGDAKYLTSLRFRKLRRQLRVDIFKHYLHMKKIFEKNFDPIEFEKKFPRRRRLDGIQI